MMSKGKRRMLFRVAALALPMLAWIMAEGLLGRMLPAIKGSAHDPWLGFSDHLDLFTLDEESHRYQIDEAHHYAFEPTGFLAEKSANTLRIFCLGGSTVQGRPYSIETAFPAWLQHSLETIHPSSQFEILNLGGISYASYRLLPILKEVLQYQPDLIILCTGHNEFLEDRSYKQLKHAAPMMGEWLQWARQSHVIEATLQLGSLLARKPTDPTPILGHRVRAILDYERGAEKYHRNTPWMRSVEQHFSGNVERMIQLCQEEEVPLILLNPCFNLKDSPPFKSEHREDWNPEVEEDWKRALQVAREQLDGAPEESIKNLRRALSLDPNYADTWYALGQCLLQQAQWQEAKRCFQRALEEDVCPLRIRASMRHQITDLARRHEIPLLDLQSLAEKEAPVGLVGDTFLVDHVHPSIHGHQTIALALVGRVQEILTKLEQRSISDEQTRLLFAGKLAELPDHYFANGLQRLENLRAWTHGKADGPPIESHPQWESGL